VFSYRILNARDDGSFPSDSTQGFAKPERKGLIHQLYALLRNGVLAVSARSA
jgi:hypothetical protein